ncbi:hypothetical protein [Nostoc sp. WHI]|uniref:hypothetical protein n=1 Tax=Nostoc sp. WHI TaxID=2650611 RepID=UPI0018C71B96|nr:hypothetical protein [Nostoc sp. WHI]
MKILDRKNVINHRHDERLIIVETAIYRVSCLNRTVLQLHLQRVVSQSELIEFSNTHYQ